VSPIARRATGLAAAALCAALACRPGLRVAEVAPTPPSKLDERLEELTGARLVGGNELTPIENGAVG
jgi:hypothetical protein